MRKHFKKHEKAWLWLPLCLWGPCPSVCLRAKGAGPLLPTRSVDRSHKALLIRRYRQNPACQAHTNTGLHGLSQSVLSFRFIGRFFRCRTGQNAAQPRPNSGEVGDGFIIPLSSCLLGRTTALSRPSHAYAVRPPPRNSEARIFLVQTDGLPSASPRTTCRSFA